ncbi:extracellular solute-binding protein [Paenibacillus eucommiae]|uniref:Aldouronate transport system substrate-binding protein n=1 Tax=Paenibacillus eucommiae TaxID=1355755 RepID=A0ABS4IMJ0_9BACL|nr:extracellular solute-binding protein [Paenibacillus eucommiae]MBP1988792.1 putative aldouronate transport system substrate-binding protein [Paenibacillus eucommiae]
MKSQKRKVLQSLSTVLLVAAIAGCSSNPSSSPNVSTTPTAAATKAPEKQMMMQFYSVTPEKVVTDGYAGKLIREHFNIDFEVQPRKGETYVQNTQLSIASGEVPDTFEGLDVINFDKLVDQDVLAEIPPELLEKHAPKYMEWLKKALGDDPLRYSMRNGKNYAMPILWTIGSKRMVFGMREDWLNKVGITKVPETLDELEAAMIKFRNEDPDNNGKKDTYGLTGGADSVEGFFSPVFGAFGLYPGLFTEKAGKVVLGEVQPGAKDALEVLHKWYKQDLIDPEFIINKGTNITDKVVSEKIGVAWNSWWAFIPAEAFSGGDFYDKLLEKNPNAKWAITSGPVGPNGEFGINQTNPVVGSGRQYAKKLEQDPDKMIKYIEIIEATNFADLELYEKLRYGEENKTYKKVNGDIEWIPPYDKEEERIKFGLSFFSVPGGFNDYDLLAPYMTKNKYMTTRKDIEAKVKGKYDLLSPIQRPVFAEYKDRLDQFTKKNLVDFVTGKRPVGEFDKYVEEWKQMGGDKVMAEAQQKYDELFKK